jgi:hypothetical protein
LNLGLAGMNSLGVLGHDKYDKCDIGIVSRMEITCLGACPDHHESSIIPIVMHTFPPNLGNKVMLSLI